MSIKKHCIAAAVLCAAVLTACGNDGEEQSGTAAEYTEITQSISESSSGISETDGIAEESTAAVSSENEAEESTASETEAAAEFSCTDITAEIESTVSLSSMAEVGADRVKMYLDFDIPEGCDFSMLICGSGGFADEIFVISAADIDITALEEAVDKRIEARKKDFEGYNPDEFDKLENVFSKYSEGYYMYAVTGDNAACENIFDKYVK